MALCDNVNQGIVPVPARLGNGDQPSTNLYWGAAFGIKTFFFKSPEWKLIESQQNPGTGILERCVFKHRTREIYMIADAYRGAEIRRTIYDLADFAAGVRETSALVNTSSNELNIIAGGGADLLVYVGHNGLMDFSLPSLPRARDTKRRNIMILCCASKYYFYNALRSANASPLLWTNGLMAPEAYILKAALDGWMINENGEKIRLRAAEAYNKYQRCGLKAARGLFATGF